jgi:hypothetical protein
MREWRDNPGANMAVPEVNCGSASVPFSLTIHAIPMFIEKFRCNDSSNIDLIDFYFVSP